MERADGGDSGRAAGRGSPGGRTTRSAGTARARPRPDRAGRPAGTPPRSPRRAADGPSGRRPAEPPRDGEPDPLRGPEDSPWVRYERLREEMSGGLGASRPSLPDLSALFAALDGLRSLVPRELSHQLTALIRELLLTLRAFIDWYLERLDEDRHEPEVEDIPIE